MKRERKLKAPSCKRFIKIRTFRKIFEDEDDPTDDALACGVGDKDKAKE